MGCPVCLRPVKRFQDAFGSSAKTLVRNALFYPTGSIFAKHKIDHDDDSDGSNSDSSDSEHYPYENLIDQASNHAEEAQQQRRLAKNRHQQAMEESKEPHDSQSFFFVFILFYFYRY